MNELTKVFNYQERQVRTVVKDGEPWFAAKDVCDILEIADTWNAVSRLSNSMKGTDIISTLGGNQEMTVINEAGVYKLVFTSRKPEAEKFTDWLATDVIPTIRKHGAYMTPETIEKAILNPDFVIDLATRLKMEQQKRIEAETKVEQQKPLVMFAESCIASKDSLLVREVAKLANKNGINIGEKRLYKRLREWGFILKGKTEPSQYAIDSGYFETTQGVYQTPYGTETYRTTRVTPKGQVCIIERLKRELQEAC